VRVRFARFWERRCPPAAAELRRCLRCGNRLRNKVTAVTTSRTGPGLVERIRSAGEGNHRSGQTRCAPGRRPRSRGRPAHPLWAADLRGLANAPQLSFGDSIRRRGCAAAGVRLAGPELSAVCRQDLYGAWRLLSVFETPDRCVLLVVAEHTRSANPYQLLYEMLGIGEPQEPRTKPACCNPDGQPPISPDLVKRFERGLRISPRAVRHRQGWRQTSPLRPKWVVP